MVADELGHACDRPTCSNIRVFSMSRISSTVVPIGRATRLSIYVIKFEIGASGWCVQITQSPQLVAKDHSFGRDFNRPETTGHYDLRTSATASDSLVVMIHGSP